MQKCSQDLKKKDIKLHIQKILKFGKKNNNKIYKSGRKAI